MYFVKDLPLKFLFKILLQIITGIVEFSRFTNSTLSFKKAIFGDQQIILDLLRVHLSLEFV